MNADAHYKWSRWAKALLLMACFIGTASCGDGRPRRVPVSGQVLIDGQPLAYGSVCFLNDEHRAASGRLDAEGRFSLTCFTPNDGAVLGHHKILINGCESIGVTKMKWHAPPKYAQAKTSGLTQDITEPINSLVINLTWAGGKPFVDGGDGPRRPGDDVEGIRYKGAAPAP